MTILLVTIGALTLLGGGLAILWHLIAFGCEEPDWNQKREAWWRK